MAHRRQNSMVRTFTSFILGVMIVPSPCSISEHAIPRQPSSQASASPTGPPPTMRTGVLFTGLLSCPRSHSVDDHPGRLADLFPFPMLNRDVGGEGLGRARLCLAASVGDHLLYFR